MDKPSFRLKKAFFTSLVLQSIHNYVQYSMEKEGNVMTRSDSKFCHVSRMWTSIVFGTANKTARTESVVLHVFVPCVFRTVEITPLPYRIYFVTSKFYRYRIVYNVPVPLPYWNKTKTSPRTKN